MEGLLGALAVLLLLLVPAVVFVVPLVAWIRATEAKRQVEELARTMHEQLAQTQQELMLARRAFDDLDARVRRLTAASPQAETPKAEAPVAWPVPNAAAAMPTSPPPTTLREPTPAHAPEVMTTQATETETVAVTAHETVAEASPQPRPEANELPFPTTTTPPPALAAQLTAGPPAAEAIAMSELAPAAMAIESVTTSEPSTPASLEERIGLVWFTRIGAAALLLGVAYFFKYAVDNAWIGPMGRLIAGALVGLGLLGFAEHGRARTKALFTNVVVGAGLSVLLFSAYASHAFYEIVPAPVATLAIALISIFGGALAVRHRAEAILILSSCAALAAPVLLSSGKDQAALLFGYVGIVSVLAHYAAVRGRFFVAPWIPIVGGAALYLGWYTRFFDGGQASSAAASSSVYEGLAARIVPLGAVVLLSVEWLGLSLARLPAEAREGAPTQPTRPIPPQALSYVVAALLFGTGGLASLLFDHPVWLTTALVIVAAATAAFARRYEAPGLFVWSELAAAAAFGAVATRAPTDFVPVTVALLGRSALVCGALTVLPASSRATSDVSFGLSLLVLTGSAAFTLGPDHPHLFLGLLVALSALVVTLAHRRDVPLATSLALLLSFPFVFVGAPPLAPIHRATSAGTIDASFLLLAGGWAAVYIVGAMSAVLTKKRAATAAPVLTSAVASLLFVMLALVYTPEDASVLRAVLAMLVGAVSLCLGAWLQRGGTVGLASVQFGLALALFVAAAGLLLSGVGITLVWAAMACVLAVLASRERNGLWLGFASLLALVVVIRLLAFDLGLPEEARALYFRTDGAQGEVFPRFLLHPRAFSLAGTATAFFVTAAVFRRDERKSAGAIAHVASFVGHAIALGLVVSEARHLAFTVPDLSTLAPLARAHVFDEAVATQADAVGVVTTLALGSYAIAVLLLGFRARTALPRYVGLGLFLVALGKLGLYDIWYLPRIYQISALVGTGALLLSASFLYARFGKRLVSLIKDGTIATGSV